MGHPLKGRGYLGDVFFKLDNPEIRALIESGAIRLDVFDELSRATQQALDDAQVNFWTTTYGGKSGTCGSEPICSGCDTYIGLAAWEDYCKNGHKINGNDCSSVTCYSEEFDIAFDAGEKLRGEEDGA